MEKGMGHIAALPDSFLFSLMAAAFVVPFIVAISMPTLRSLLMFALVMVAVQFATTALLKSGNEALVRFFLWSALGCGSAAGAVIRWIWLARRERRFGLPENSRSGGGLGQFLQDWPAGKDGGPT
jgi:hypothetical protein